VHTKVFSLALVQNNEDVNLAQLSKNMSLTNKKNAFILFEKLKKSKKLREYEDIF
jgi:hypothetical protein